MTGVSAKRLRGTDLNSSVWGVRHPLLSDPDVRQRCAMFAVRMPPGAFFSHSTAAQLTGIPIPWRILKDPALHISVPAPARAPHASGIRGHSLSVPSEHLVHKAGLLITGPARTWCDLASQLDLLDLIAAGDYLLQWRAPLVTLDELASAAQAFPGRRGVLRMRAAIPYLIDRSESVPESHLRVILIRGGLPEPRANPTFRLQGETVTVRLDLAFDEYKVLLEYQGDYHRTSKDQWRKDMTRRSRLEAEGWLVIEVNADDLRNPEELVSRVRRVLVSRGWRG